MNLYEIRWDRESRRYRIQEPGGHRWLKDWQTTYEYVFQAAKHNAPALVKHYKADGSVKEYKVKQYPLKKFGGK